MKKLLFYLIIFGLLLSGCETMPWKKKTKESTTSPTPTLNQVFYNFPDVPVPKELTLDTDKTFIYETGGIRTGVLALSGNVEIESLKNYFKTSMIKNGWKLINSFEFKDIILNFMKEDRFCNVQMSRGAFRTEVMVWIGPIERGLKLREIETK